MSLVTLAAAIERLRAADVVALPTETVYGLAARIDSEPALLKIFATKQRPSFDPLIVHVADVAAARALSSAWPSLYDALAEKFWPGPLTLIAPKAPHVSPTITSGLASVAIRQPSHPLFLEALRGVGVPLAAPSANRFGRTSPTTAAHVEDEFTGAVAVVDGGACDVGVESTVLKAEPAPSGGGNRWILKILRPGGVSREQLTAYLNDRQFKFELTRESSAASPGNLKEHYQPESPLVILTSGTWSSTAAVLAAAKLKALGKVRGGITGASEIKLPATPQEAARALYAELRRLARGPDHILWIARKPEHAGENWEAVWDRIERASSVSI